MPIYRPSELLNFLSALNISPKKILSQNFLIDGNVVKKILETAKVTSGDLVIEIGPGPGALTEALLEQGARIIAIEKDEVLAAALKRFKTDSTELYIFADDIMTFPIEETMQKFLKKGEKLKIIANLPYHLTSAIIEKLIPMETYISSLTLMVQEEVAKKFTAPFKTKRYSFFSLFLQFYSTPSYAFRVQKKCFLPAPHVDSAVITIDLAPPPFKHLAHQFLFFLRTAFQQRRKTLKSSLKIISHPENTQKALEKLHHSSETRPEELSLEEFLQLFLELHVEKECLETKN